MSTPETVSRKSSRWSLPLLVLACCSALTSAAARADHTAPGYGAGPVYGAPPRAVCRTESNGYRFSHDSNSVQWSHQEAVRKCQQHSWTNNNECAANAACDGYPAAPMITCRTDSRGYRFSDQSRDPNLAMSEAVRQCKQHSWTSNQECEINAYCDGTYLDPVPGPYQPPVGGYHPPTQPPYGGYPAPYPGTPVPPGAHPAADGYPCHNQCVVGAKCSDACPWGAVCNYVSSKRFFRVTSCSR